MTNPTTPTGTPTQTFTYPPGAPSPDRRPIVPVPFSGFGQGTTTANTPTTSPTYQERFGTLHVFGAFTPAPVTPTTHVLALMHLGTRVTGSPTPANQPFGSPQENTPPANPGDSLLNTPIQTNSDPRHLLEQTAQEQIRLNTKKTPTIHVLQGPTTPPPANVSQLFGNTFSPAQEGTLPSVLFPGAYRDMSMNLPQTPPNTALPLSQLSPLANTPPASYPLSSEPNSADNISMSETERSSSPLSSPSAPRTPSAGRLDSDTSSPFPSSLSIRTTPSPISDNNNTPNLALSSNAELIGTLAPSPRTPPQTSEHLSSLGTFPVPGYPQTPSAQIIPEYYPYRPATGFLPFNGGTTLRPFTEETRLSAAGLPLPPTHWFETEESTLTRETPAPLPSGAGAINPGPSTQTTPPRTPAAPISTTPWGEMPPTPHKRRDH